MFFSVNKSQRNKGKDERENPSRRDEGHNPVPRHEQDVNKRFYDGYVPVHCQCAQVGDGRVQERPLERSQ